MTTRAEKSKWRVIGETRRGASHVRSGLRNQDSIEYWSSAHNDTIVLAVADGHGSGTFIRSDTGSRLAVETSVKILREFVERHSMRTSIATILDLANEEIPSGLMLGWRRAVLAHLDSKPITEEESRQLSTLTPDLRKRVEHDPVFIYGTTILAVLATDAYVLFLQLGDGDILAVDVTGKTNRPIKKDERLVGNETFSLCQPDAAEEFRISVQDGGDLSPCLILVSTDGYSNSFVSDDDFLMIGADYLNIIRTQGLESAENNLASFLDETSAQGSGDDITLGLISRVEHEHAAPAADLEEEDVSVAIAEKLTAELDAAGRRIDQLDSAVTRLSTRVRWLQIALAIAVAIAIAGLVLSVYHRLPRPATRSGNAAAEPGAVQPSQ